MSKTIDISSEDLNFGVRKRKAELSTLRFIKENLELLLAEKRSNEIEVIKILNCTHPDLTEEAKRSHDKVKMLFTYYRIVTNDLDEEIYQTEQSLKRYQAMAENKSPQSFTSTN